MKDLEKLEQIRKELTEPELRKNIFGYESTGAVDWYDNAIKSIDYLISEIERKNKED